MLARFADSPAPPTDARVRVFGLARRGRRRGMTIVESALVLGVFLMLLFGMFEYCRFLFVLHVTNNAARDGARYAAVRVNCPSDQVTATQTAIITYTTQRMGSMQKNIEGFAVAVYAVDQTGLDQSPPIIRPKTTSTASPKVYPDPFKANEKTAVPWNTATFTERIAVTIKGTYRPIVPTLLMMPSTIPINITSIMGSEG